MLMFFRLEQSTKHPSPKEVTEFGITILVRFVHPAKQPLISGRISPSSLGTNVDKLLTESGIMIDFNPVQ